MTTISVVDTETTGLDPKIHRIIEVASARVDDDNWESFLIHTERFTPSLEDYARGEARAYEVNGYRPKHADWEDAPELDTPEAVELWSQVAKRLHLAPMVGYNTRFDAKFIWEELARHRVTRVNGSTPYDGDDIKGSPWQGYSWDVMDFSRAIMKKAGRRGYKLSVTYEEVCKGPPLPPHRAEADVLRTLWVLAEGKAQFPEIWPDFKVNQDAIKQAVTVWCERREREPGGILF